MKLNAFARILPRYGLIFFMIFANFSCKKNLKADGNGAGQSTAPRAIAYQLVWADEFNGTSLNTANWNIDIGNPGVNSEQEYYQAANVVEARMALPMVTGMWPAISATTSTTRGRSMILFILF